LGAYDDQGDEVMTEAVENVCVTSGAIVPIHQVHLPDVVIATK
jgi:hypothetical protein